MSKNLDFRIEDALAFHEKNKKSGEPSILKKDLAEVFFAGAKPKTIPVNMSNLVSGKTTRIDPEWVKHTCKVTGVDANFLFGIDPMDEKLKKEFYGEV